MSGFDERFADRVREVFDVYEEPVDEGALNRMRAALGHAADGVPVRGGDRPPVARGGPGPSAGRARRYGLVAFAVALLAGGVWLWSAQPDPAADRPLVAVASEADAPEAVQGTDAPTGPDAGAGSGAGLEPRSAESAALGPAPGPGRSARAPAPAGPPPVAPSRRAPSAPVPTPAEPPPDADAVAAALPSVAQVDPEGLDPSNEADSVGPGPEGLPDVAASVFAPGVRGPVALADLPALTPGPDPEGSDEGGRHGFRLVVATAATFSGARLADGAGLSTGLTREWALGQGVTLSGGALAAYNRFVVDPSTRGSADLLPYLEGDPTRTVEVTTRTTVTTLALEVPLDVALDLARAGGGRVRAGVGLTSALYVAQTFEDERRRYSLAPASGGGGTAGEVQVDPFTDREEAPPLGRLDLGRQLNLSLGYAAGAGGLGVDVFARVPLGGVTARDLPLTAVGLRLRYALR